MRARASIKQPAPAPCVTVKYVGGKPVETVVETRDPLRFNDREPEKLARRFRVMAEQETGEELFVSYARTLGECDMLIAAHLVAHPEHRACWFERL